MKKVFVANPAPAGGAKDTSGSNPLPLVVGNSFQGGNTMAKHRNHNRKAGAGRNRRHSHNPLGMPWMQMLKLALGAFGGILASTAIPGYVLSMLGQPDSGFLSYVIALIAVAGPAYVLRNMTQLAQGYLAGGLGAIGWRAYDDLSTSNVLSINSPGMSSFFTKPVRYPLPAANVFGAYGRGGPAMLTAGTGVGVGQTSSPMAVSQGAKAGGMSYVQY